MVFPVVIHGSERWAINRAGHWRIDGLDLWCWRRLFSSLDFKEIKPVHPKGNQPWVFIGRTDAEAEAPILWPPDMKSCLIQKGVDTGKDWGQEEKGRQGEMVGQEFEQTQGNSERTGKPGVLQSVASQSWAQLSNWITTVLYLLRQRSLKYTVNILCNSQIVRIKTDYLKCSSIWKSYLYRISYFNINKKSNYRF